MDFCRLHVFVSGKVQGVYFRQNTAQKAQELNVFGWVRNLKDGRVEAVFEGEKESVHKMVNWCSNGPKDAAVVNMEVTDEDYVNEFSNFQVMATV